MLALTRKTGEFIRITVPPSSEPQTISICFVNCQRGAAKIGFNAPRHIEIARTELLDTDRPPVAEAATAI